MFALGPYAHEPYFPANEVSQSLSLFSINGFIDPERKSNGPILVSGGVGHEVGNIDLRSMVTWLLVGVRRRAADIK
jgi:hypothetical protein